MFIIFIYFCSAHKARIFVSNYILFQTFCLSHQCGTHSYDERQKCLLFLYILVGTRAVFLYPTKFYFKLFVLVTNAERIHMTKDKKLFIIFNYFCSAHKARIFVSHNK